MFSLCFGALTALQAQDGQQVLGNKLESAAIKTLLIGRTISDSSSRGDWQRCFDRNWNTVYRVLTGGSVSKGKWHV